MAMPEFIEKKLFSVSFPYLDKHVFDAKVQFLAPNGESILYLEL